VSESQLAERFDEVCRDRASAVAVHDLSERATVTFTDLFEQYRNIRRALEHAGLGQGTLLASLVGNRAVFFPLVVACFDAGVTLLPLGETTTSEAVALVERSGAAAVVTDRTLPLAPLATAALPGSVTLLSLKPAGATLAQSHAAILKLTSGSTELPRVAVATEAHLVNDGRHIIEGMGIDRADINLACIPLSHSYALGNIVAPLVWQGTAVALRQSFAPAQFIPDVEASGATVFPGVPFMFERLATLPLGSVPKNLRLLISAGAPIGLATVEWFSAHLARKIHSFYGSSETGGISYDASETVDDRVHVGTALPETTVSLRASEDGEPGRVFVTGNAVTAGYAGDNPTSTAFVDGGFLLTDQGHFDPKGRLVLTGRVSTLVNVAGRKVDPAEIERVLRAFPEIRDARVLGTACDHRGEQLAAIIVAREPGLTAANLRQRCAALLSAYKIPRRFVFLNELPVNARGKVDRRTLEALVAAEADA